MARHTIKPKRNGEAPRKPRRLDTINTYERAISGLMLRHGDKVTMEGKWAIVTITVEIEGHDEIDGGRGRPKFVVTGNTMPTAKGPQRFDTARDAFGYALVCLTYYAEGRTD